ncbi:hypothetical protein AAY473_012800 [Plecturocebus cupreus]
MAEFSHFPEYTEQGSSILIRQEHFISSISSEDSGKILSFFPFLAAVIEIRLINRKDAPPQWLQRDVGLRGAWIFTRGFRAKDWAYASSKQALSPTLQCSPSQLYSQVF